jgi:hypothetical protein
MYIFVQYVHKNNRAEMEELVEYFKTLPLLLIFDAISQEKCAQRILTALGNTKFSIDLIMYWYR